MDNKAAVVEEIRSFIAKKNQRRRENLEQLYKSACRDFTDICKIIIEKYNPTALWQWGSLLDQKHFSEISDIDIALEGVVETAVFFQILRDTERMTSFPLDIIQLEAVEPVFAAKIKQNGKVIYERG